MTESFLCECAFRKKLPRGEGVNILKIQRMLRTVLLFLAVVFVLVGIWRDEARTVFVKAATICLECIGIG